MVKSSGSPNYKLAGVARLLELVKDRLSLGMDEWKRLSDAYNLSRVRGWAERDYDSLRRKFKALYGLRKPTGEPNMPPHVKQAKLLKKALDEKASVVKMNDAADKDGCADEEDDPDPLGDLCFDFEPEDVLTDEHAIVHGKKSTGSDVPATVGELQEAPVMPIVGLEAFASTPRPAPLVAPSTRRSLRLKKTPNMADDAVTACSLTAPLPLPAARGYKPGGADEQEALRHPTLIDYSNRLGGTNLYTFRDTVGAKRALREDDKDITEASYAKAKRTRAIKATTLLKDKFCSIEKSSSSMGSSMFEMMLMLREDSERKAETRRLEEDQRRRDAAQAKEERQRAEKAEVEGRRRQEKLEMEERARRDREDARARTQELLLFIDALTKKG
ncbi:hypothetical protein PInf_025160 [Phytophthora infestans]|nr:hypothetical protein PInf_025160 [Phytophthora infestans]